MSLPPAAEGVAAAGDADLHRRGIRLVVDVDPVSM